jgi:hypothetical protein
VKLTARIAVTFSRSGSARTDSVGDAVTAAVPRDFKGTSASTSAPIGRALVVLVLAITGLAIAASSALAATPELKIDPAVTAGYATVEFSGEIGEGNPVFWFSEFSTDGGNSWQEGFTFPGESPSGESDGKAPKPLVNLVQKGLAPGTTYKVRLAVFDLVTEEIVHTAEPSPEFTTKSVAAPSATLAPITTETDTTATFNATIDPNSPGGLSEEDQNLFATEYAFHCSPACPGLSGGTVPAEATGTELEVQANATGLEPNTEYTVTLTATNRGGEVTVGPQTFSTDEIKPTVTAGPGSALGEGEFQLAGTVNSHNSPITSCYFEYGTTTSYDRTVPCETIPAAANKASFVTASVSDLVIGTEYHFHLVASNGAGPTPSADAAFLAQEESCPNEAIRREQHSTYLPECRAYEQVSPEFKEAFPLAPVGFTDDGRLAYETNGNFADNGNGAAAIPGGNLYLGTRTANGWSTTALSPPGPEFYTPLASPLTKGFSSDLGATLWQMRRGNEPESVNDLYVRRGDAFTRIGPIPHGPTGGVKFFNSDDLSHMAFLGDQSGVYEYVGDGSGGPRMVSVDNAGQPIEPGCLSIMGGQLTSYHAMSADGHAIFWTPECGSSVYARVDGTTTINASASQCTRNDCNAESPAVFQGADANGTRVYFTTSQQLINSDTDETNDLYECDIPSGTPAPVGAVNPCPDLREVSGAASGARVQGVTRISDDGSRVYFVATGVLASNTDANGAQAAAGDDNLYVWTRDAAHPAGETQFVARLDQADGPTQISGGLWGADLTGRFAQTTNDGRYLVFASYAPLIDHGPQADTDTARDIYRYDAETGALTRLSTDADGSGGNEPGQDAQITPVDYDTVTFPTSRPTRVTMSDDGGSVVFTTGEALAPGDTNGTVDTYLWHQGRVSLISSGKPSLDGPIAGAGDPFGTSTLVQALISPSGRDVYFTTTAQLVSGDDDTVVDVYDARIDGGFASPEAAEPCTGESCRSAAASPPVAPPSTTQAPGAGNPTTPKRCPKGKLKKHGRCVKKQVKKRHASKHRHPAKHRSAGDKRGRK